MAWATWSPAIRPARARPMSMPEETPAAVTYLPSNTTRSVTGAAPSCPSSSMASQCVVARRPVSRPAAARTRDPVQTDVVQVVAWSAARSHSCTGEPAEHLVRADSVEAGEPVEEQDGDLHVTLLSCWCRANATGGGTS